MPLSFRSNFRHKYKTIVYPSLQNTIVSSASKEAIGKQQNRTQYENERRWQWPGDREQKGGGQMESRIELEVVMLIILSRHIINA